MINSVSVEGSYTRTKATVEELLVHGYTDAKGVILLYPYNEYVKNEQGELVESWYLEHMPNKKIEFIL